MKPFMAKYFGNEEVMVIRVFLDEGKALIVHRYESLQVVDLSYLTISKDTWPSLLG